MFEGKPFGFLSLEHALPFGGMIDAFGGRLSRTIIGCFFGDLFWKIGQVDFAGVDSAVPAL